MKRFTRMGLAAILAVPMALVAMFGIPASADGPHWQLPNPWTEYEMENEGRPRPPKVTEVADGGRFQKGLKTSPLVNPGANGLEGMDDKCIAYYEEHCAIKYPGNKSEFYLMIMDKAGQVFAEVQDYCPCPDSYPLWHSEEGREFMRWAAQQTWVASTKLPQKDAQACAKYIATYYVTALRFSNDPDMVKKMKEFLDYNAKCAELVDKIGKETDKGKIAAATAEWRAFAKGAGMRTTAAAIKDLDGVKYITGDIKYIHEMTINNMSQAIINMGPSVLPALAEAMKTGGPAVQKAVWLIADTIKRNAGKPAPPPSRPAAKKAEPQKAPEPAPAKEAEKPVEKKPEAPKVNEE